MATYKSIKYIIPTEAVEHTDSINALADVDTTTVAPSVGQTLKWSAANSRWQPADIEESASGTQKALFGFGQNDFGATNKTNLVSSSGVVSSDTTGVGTARYYLAASGYGGDKAIFGFGFTNTHKSETNLVSNTGVVASDTTGVGTARSSLTGSGYGGDKAIFGFGIAFGNNKTSVTNLVSSSGVVASDTTGVGTARYSLAASGYGGDKAIFGFGVSSDYTNISNLVSNAGVVSSDTTGVGTSRAFLAASGYGGDKAIFGFGNDGTIGGYGGASFVSTTNLVSNIGVVATDTTGVGTGRAYLAASGYGGDKAIFGFGFNEINYTQAYFNVTNLVSNTGVVASDTTGVGLARQMLAAAGYSTTA